MNITEAVENNLACSASMAMLLAARPDAAELLRQAFRVGFADGALWQSIKISDYASTMTKRDQLERHEGRQDHDMTAHGVPLKVGT